MNTKVLTARSVRRYKTKTTDFDSSVSYLLTALGNRISVIAARDIKKLLGLSLMEWRVLAVLAAEPAAPPGRIIDLVGVNKAAVSRAANSLERQRLIRRVPASDHGLRTHLYLTPAGEAVHARGVGGRLQMDERLLTGLAATERKTVANLLRHMLKHMMSNLWGSTASQGRTGGPGRQTQG